MSTLAEGGHGGPDTLRRRDVYVVWAVAEPKRAKNKREFKFLK